MTSSLTMALARYAASTTFPSIPHLVREQAKRVIMDEMASACLGSRSTAGRLAARHVSSLGGAPESRVLGTTLLAPAAHAAMANGMAGHSDDVDGTHVAGGHPGATIVHAALAASEKHQVSGAELVNAVVLGYDIGTRVLLACGGMHALGSRHHLHSDFLYAVGAAAAAGRIAGLTPIGYCHAMALVTFQANGLMAVFQESRHISKPFSNGQYAAAGVNAALMAANGFEGTDDIMGARGGLLDAWGTDHGADALTRGLGSDYAVMGANFKLMSACYPIHSAVEAALALVDAHGIAVDDIAHVHAGLPAKAVPVVDNRKVHNTCLQDMLCAALLRGAPSLTVSPFPGVLDDQRFAGLRTRISVGVDPDLEREHPDGRGANVAIRMRSGAMFSTRVDWPRGHSRRGGADWSTLSGKWRDTLADCDVHRMLAMAQEMEHLPDVRALSAAFC